MYIVIFNYDQKNHSLMIDMKGFLNFYSTYEEAEEKAKSFIKEDDEWYRNFKIFKIEK